MNNNLLHIFPSLMRHLKGIQLGDVLPCRLTVTDNTFCWRLHVRLSMSREVIKTFVHLSTSLPCASLLTHGIRFVVTMDEYFVSLCFNQQEICWFNQSMKALVIRFWLHPNGSIRVYVSISPLGLHLNRVDEIVSLEDYCFSFFCIIFVSCVPKAFLVR